MRGAVRTIVIVVGIVAIVALLLGGTGEKGRLRQTAALPATTDAAQGLAPAGHGPLA